MTTTSDKIRKPKLTAFLGIRLDADLHDFVLEEAEKHTGSNVNRYIRTLLEKARARKQRT
tara:strand:+ start:83 stop:262 length:180 start_codon:yes stop_codon:yes gene_type:complete